MKRPTLTNNQILALAGFIAGLAIGTALTLVLSTATMTYILAHVC